MKNLFLFFSMAFVAFACQLQNEDVQISDLSAGAATPGAYSISSSSSDGLTFTVTIDQSKAQDISHLVFQLMGCDGESLLNVNNITSATTNGIDWMGELSGTLGNGDVCLDVFTGNVIKFDNFNFDGGTVVVVFTLDTQSSGGAFLIKSAQNCFGFGNEEYMFSYDCDKVCYDYKGDTAWSAGERYVARGNWATYTAYAEGTVNVFAGQHKFAGTASFSSVEDGLVTISISLNEGWSLQNGGNIKIQGYDVAPSGNPSPGRFTTYKGTSFEVTVPAANFYGIHLDVQSQVQVPCE